MVIVKGKIVVMLSAMMREKQELRTKLEDVILTLSLKLH